MGGDPRLGQWIAPGPCKPVIEAHEHDDKAEADLEASAGGCFPSHHFYRGSGRQQRDLAGLATICHHLPGDIRQLVRDDIHGILFKMPLSSQLHPCLYGLDSVETIQNKTAGRIII